MVTPLQSVRGLLLEAAFDPAALKGALNAFADFCGAPIAHLMVADGRRTLLESTFSREMDPERAASEGDFQHINPRVLAIPHMQQGKSTRDKDFIAYDDILRDQTYQELILPMGLGHFSGVPLIHTSQLTAGIALHRPITDDPFDDEIALRHERVSAECLPVFQLIAAIEDQNASNMVNLLGEHSGTAAVDRSGRVIIANETFDSHLHSGQIKLTQDRKISLPGQRDQLNLSRCLNGQHGFVGGKFIVSSGLGRRLIICQVFPVPPITTFRMGHARALVSFRLLEKPRTVDEALVEDAFGLTRAEAQVACLLFIGLNIEEISQRRGVSIGTTRTLMKRVLNKSNCSRQAELMAKLNLLI